MSAATGSTAGTAGLVPAPQAGAQDKFLRGDGTWVDLFSEYDAMVFKGIVIQDSDLPTSEYSAGWTYRAAADGIYKGEYCEVGDLIIAVNDYDSSTASNADWTKIEHNIDGALFMGHAGSALSDGTKLLNVTGGGVVTTSSSTVGSLTKPVFLNAGTLTETTHSLNATINSGTANQVAYYSDANTIDSMAPAWQPWTAGSTNGPQANIQIGNAIYQSAAIPSATATDSGIVTTVAQTFAGDKTFQGNVFPAVSDSYNLGSTALRWKFLYGVRGIDLTNTGATGITINNTDIAHSSSYKIDAAGLAGIYDDSHTFWVLSTDQPYGDTWLKSKANRNIIFERNGTENARFDTAGHFIPGTTETFNLGSTTNYWNNAYIKNIIYSSGEANRLVWTDNNKLIKAANHYADATSIAINSTTIPTPPTGYPTYNLYINGDARSSGDLYFEGTNNKLAAFKLTTVGTVPRANIDMGWDWEKLDGAGAAFRSTDPNLAANQIGRFVLFARTTADDTTQLVGAPTGELSWKKVSGTARVGINADANANYNLYVNGSQKIDSGSLQVYPTGGSYNDGIRIHTRSSDNNWAGLMLCGTDNTGDTGTSANSWFIANNAGTLYVSLNGSSSATVRLTGHNATGFSARPRFAVNADVNTSYNLYVNGTTYLGGNATLEGSSTLSRAGKSISWNQANTYAMLRMTSQAGWSPMLALKANTGWWTMGHYNTSGYNDHLLFGFLADVDVSGVTNAKNHLDYTVRLIPTVYATNTTTVTDRAFVTSGYASSSAAKGSATVPVYVDASGVVQTITSYSGNAATATKLATARSINGTNFDGSANITTANWGTARTITIGSKGKSVNGSANVSWSLAEIGATVSNAWTAGTTAGPTIKTTVNGVTGTAVAIPTATASASGVVTTGAQTWAGNKTFSGSVGVGAVNTGFRLTIQAPANTAANLYLKSSTSGRWSYIRIHNNVQYWDIGSNSSAQGSIPAGALSFGYNGANDGVWITTGKVLMGAAWNDYAEFRKVKDKEKVEPGRCVKEIGDGTLEMSTERLQRGCEIVSDTFGFVIGPKDDGMTPTAATGRVLAYPYESREEFAKHIGWPVCSGPNGTVSIMTEEEEEKYPSRIIGIISEIPTYNIWHGGEDIEVNGRVWIRIR